MAADDFTMQAARVLKYTSRNIPVSATEWLMVLVIEEQEHFLRSRWLSSIMVCLTQYCCESLISNKLLSYCILVDSLHKGLAIRNHTNWAILDVRYRKWEHSFGQMFEMNVPISYILHSHTPHAFITKMTLKLWKWWVITSIRNLWMQILTPVLTYLISDDMYIQC